MGDHDIGRALQADHPGQRAGVDAGLPVFGICLGHQMLAIAAGARTIKMHQGHR
ncbi:MAG TPA: gamma-glutamyl-gamma-aminobutyrate hydrolase family protein, partial [Sphingobium sp.]|nr:gamma-glutamyl-gamma-aminobutyrate hydrolase family protein [Sphingobium sp.]